MFFCSKQFDQVLSNLVANALRHTPSGGSVRLNAKQNAEVVTILSAIQVRGLLPLICPLSSISFGAAIEHVHAVLVVGWVCRLPIN